MADSTRNGDAPQPADDFDFEPRTELARELWEIRKRAIAAGMKLLTDEELEREIAERRGSLVIVREGSPDDADVR